MNNFQITNNDPWLAKYINVIRHRFDLYIKKRDLLLEDSGKSISDFANGHKFFGCFKNKSEIIFREWMPNAKQLYLIGDFSNWKENPDYAFKKVDDVWQLTVSNLSHGEIYRLKVKWDGGEGERIPAWSQRVVQDELTKVFSAQIWFPSAEYIWKNKIDKYSESPIIYEAHIGMSGEDEKVSGFKEFRINVLPRIKELGYNTIQLMAIQEHPYYGSFGYHVSGFFAVSSRFGTPNELRELIDEAHGMNIQVIMDIVHSHAVKNEIEGLGCYDGTRYQFFHKGNRGEHPAWDSYCFNYDKHEVLHFLLSNIKYWIDEFRFDGFRFDGVTSMLYYDHGLERDFTSYEFYFDGGQDEDALVYLMLANELIHELKPNALSVAEEMSGYPGLASSIEYGGIGFDFRLAMGIPDFWIKYLKEKRDEEWDLGLLFHELTSKRDEEKTISYAESHDQALVGDKTIAFRLMEQEMYHHMLDVDQNLIIDRGIALHKLIRLFTITTAGGGYLNFMGNEFGHPEWIDFPREGNNWSYKYAVRQWSLVDRMDLKYRYLNEFDKQMVKMVSDKNLLSIFPITLQHDNNNDKVLAFSRSNLLFIFNLHPEKSFTDYGISVGKGRYKYFMGSDELRFGGFGRVDELQQFHSITTSADGNKHQINVYIPSRTVLVLEKLPIKGVRKL